LEAQQKATERVSELLAGMRSFLPRVEDADAIEHLSKRLVAAGNWPDAIASLSRYGLDRFLKLLAELAPLLQPEGAVESTTVLEEAASIAGWTRQDWFELSALFQAT